MSDLIAAAQRILDDCMTWHTSRQHDYDRACPAHQRAALMVLGYRDSSRSDRARQRRLMDTGWRPPNLGSRDAAELAEAIRVIDEVLGR